MRESALESLSENLNDSVIAPLFWFALLGLPGAALFRFADTADSMWGYRGVYRGQVWEWAGKWAARWMIGWPGCRRASPGWRCCCPAAAHALLRLRQRLQQEAAPTPSPNSGWPMAALALVLDVQLRKPGVYTLHAAGQAAQAGHVPRAVQMTRVAVLGLLGLTILFASAGRVRLAGEGCMTDTMMVAAHGGTDAMGGGRWGFFDQQQCGGAVPLYA